MADDDHAAIWLLPFVVDALSDAIFVAPIRRCARLKLADVAFIAGGAGAVELRRTSRGLTGAAIQTRLRIALVRNLWREMIVERGCRERIINC